MLAVGRNKNTAMKRIGREGAKCSRRASRVAFRRLGLMFGCSVWLGCNSPERHTSTRSGRPPSSNLLLAVQIGAQDVDGAHAGSACARGAFLGSAIGPRLVVGLSYLGDSCIHPLHASTCVEITEGAKDMHGRAGLRQRRRVWPALRGSVKPRSGWRLRAKHRCSSPATAITIVMAL